jgi:uncharacterized protein (UPF0332 family)
MKPEAADYLEKARENLAEAGKIYTIGLASVAARSAYYATFHAAEAFIVSQTGKIAKSHSGVRSEFSRLTKDDPRISREFRKFLAKAYVYKEIGDYGVGKKSVITMPMAKSAIDTAGEFVDCIAGFLAAPKRKTRRPS